MDSEEALNKLLSETVGIADLLEHMRDLIEIGLNRLEALGKGGGGGGGPKPPPKGGGGEGVLAMLGRFAGAIAAAVSAVLAFIALPPLMTAVAAHFVQALNPGLVEQFEVTLRNLQATIGTALEPVIQHATNVIRQWSAVLLPAMQQLRPILGQLVEAIGTVLIAVLQHWVDGLRVVIAVLSPLIRGVLVLVKAIGQLMEVFNVVVEAATAFAEAQLAAAGVLFDVNEVMDAFKSTLHKAAIGLTYLAVAVLKAAGALNTIATFREALEKRIRDRRTASGAVAAPKDVGTSGIESIAQRMSERAFAAQGGPASRTDTELLDDILQAVKDAEKLDLRRIIADGVRDAGRDAINSIPGISTARAIGSAVSDVSSNPFVRVGLAVANPGLFLANEVANLF